MNKRTIRNFLDRIIPGLHFEFRYGSNKFCEDSPAAVDEDCTIWINKDTFKRFEEIEQKGILMHEVGHILIGDFKSVVDNEYFAQIMALGIARKNGWKKLYKEVRRTFHEWAYEFQWNDNHGDFRRYILAGKRYECLKDKRKSN